MRYSLFLSFCLLLTLFSCKNEITPSSHAKPAAMGVINEIVAVADEEDWGTMIGDTFQYYFASAYPIMPQPEPFFDIRHFTLEELNGEPLRKQLRTYVILCNLNDDESAITKMVRKDLGEDRFIKARKDGELKTSVGKDKWARNQIAIYILGRNEDELASNIKNGFSAIAKRINIHDQVQLKAKVYGKNVNLGLSNTIKETFGSQLEMPADYQEVLKKDGYSWYRKDTKDATLNLVFKKIPYTDVNEISKSKMLELSNSFGKLVDNTSLDNYLRVSEEHLPILEYAGDIDGNYMKEFRGIWEMTVDFTGGPFVSYLIHNKQAGELINVFGFVHAPSKQKRDYVQQLDYLVNTIQF